MGIDWWASFLSSMWAWISTEDFFLLWRLIQNSIEIFQKLNMVLELIHFSSFSLLCSFWFMIFSSPSDRLLVTLIISSITNLRWSLYHDNRWIFIIILLGYLSILYVSFLKPIGSCGSHLSTVVKAYQNQCTSTLRLSFWD